MSKLEKALNKAKTSRSLQLVKSDSHTDTENTSASSQLVPAGENSVGKSVALRERASSVLRIAKMEEGNVKSRRELSEQRIIFSDMEDKRVRDVFRDIRTKILRVSEGRNCTVMITAPGSGSGTSFISLNLAAAFSIDESKTSLLMDCNLSDPGLSIALEKYQDNGLTDFLENDDLDVGSIIHPIGVKRMRFIPAGERREVAGEYFTSIRMKEMITDITDRYPERFLIVDSPPILESADSHIMSELCDYVVMVVPYGKYTSSQVQKAINAIGQKKLIGIILNNDPGVSVTYVKMLLKNLSDNFKQILSDKFKQVNFIKNRKQ